MIFYDIYHFSSLLLLSYSNSSILTFSISILFIYVSYRNFSLGKSKPIYFHKGDAKYSKVY